MGARANDPHTSHAAATAFVEQAATVDARIVQLARVAGRIGITQSDAVEAMPEYKPGSITPRFVRLVRRGALIRVRIGTSKPTKHFPCGRPLYQTRVDSTTGQKVLLHWAPQFAPPGIEVTEGGMRDSSLASMKPSANDHIENSALDEVHHHGDQSLHDSECEHNG